EANAHLVTAGFGAGIADRSAGLDAAGFGDGARARQDGFEKCSFTALERAHQRNAPGTAGTSGVLSHCRLLIWSSALDWVGGRDGLRGFATWQAGKTSLALCPPRVASERDLPSRPQFQAFQPGGNVDAD